MLLKIQLNKGLLCLLLTNHSFCPFNIRLLLPVYKNTKFLVQLLYTNPWFQLLTFIPVTKSRNRDQVYFCQRYFEKYGSKHLSIAESELSMKVTALNYGIRAMWKLLFLTEIHATMFGIITFIFRRIQCVCGDLTKERTSTLKVWLSQNLKKIKFLVPDIFINSVFKKFRIVISLTNSFLFSFRETYQRQFKNNNLITW